MSRQEQTSASTPAERAAISPWIEEWLARLGPVPLQDSEVYVIPRGLDSLQMGCLSVEAFWLHFTSYSRCSHFPKWRGHINLAEDVISFRGRGIGRARTERIRNELIYYGLRQWCQGDGYKLCDETCQSIVNFTPARVSNSPNADNLRRAARAVLPTSGLECVECQSGDDLTVDHIVPIALGGGNDPDNLRVLCRPCNSRKGARF